MNKALLALLGVLMVATGCSAATEPDEVGLQYDDGPTASKRFEECIGTGERNWHGFGDFARLYPASQSNLVFSGADDADAGRITFVTKDGIEMAVSGVLNFRLNTSCKKVEIDGEEYKGGVLQYFHELIGNRYKAYDEDGERSDGWNKVLNIYLAKPLDTAVDRAGQQYTYQELYNDAAKKATWETDVLELLPGLVDRQTDGEDVSFFTDYALTLQKPDPPQAIKDALLEQQKAVAEANAAKAKADAQVAQAVAETEVAKQEALKQQALVSGFGSFENYIQFVMAGYGLNPFQPQYIIGGTQAPEKK